MLRAATFGLEDQELTRWSAVLALGLALTACNKPASQPVAARQAPQEPSIRIAQAGSTIVVPTVVGTGTVALRERQAIAPGARAQTGAPSYSLRLALPAADAARVPLGATAKVRFAAFNNDIVVGRLIALAPQTGSAGSVLAEVTLPNDARLKVGQTGVASIVASGAGTRLLAVPPSAVFARQGTMAQVYVVDLATSRVHLRRITLGEETPAGIAVARGLSLGEWVALSRAEQLKDGMKIAPIGPQ
ncbi:efflux transporter, RND family, MFP subunit [compost metagenome]